MGQCCETLSGRGGEGQAREVRAETYSHQKKKGTVVCIHGLASNALEYKVKGRTTYENSYCHIGQLIKSPQGFLESLKLELAVDMDDPALGKLLGDTDCEWMFGDAATGVFGIAQLAHLNPLRWSGSLTLKDAIGQLLELQEHEPDRPIILKIPSGPMTEENRFDNCKAALNHLYSEAGFYVANDAKDHEFQPCKGIQAMARLNPKESMPPVAVWQGLVDALREYDCEGFNYDWRKWGCPRYSSTLPKKFRALVEPLVKRDKKPVTLIAHSMGGPVCLYVLNELGAQWQKDYIKEVVLVAPAPMGSVCMVPSFSNNPVSAVANIFHAPEMLEDKIEETTVTWAGMVAEMPVCVGELDVYSKDDPIVITSTKKYYLKDMQEFLSDLTKQLPDRNMGSAMYGSVKNLSNRMKGPVVQCDIIYNNAQQTVAQVSYAECNDSFENAPKVTKYEDGDNTVIAKHVERMAFAWKKQGLPTRCHNTADKVDHKNLINGAETIDIIKKLLRGEAPEERLLSDSFCGSKNPAAEGDA